MRVSVIGNQRETIKAAPTSRTLIEIINAEISRSYPNGELELVVDASDGNNVNPKKKDLHLNTIQVGEPALGNSTSNCGLVLEIVRIDFKATSTV